MSKSIQLKNQDNEKMYPHPYYPVGSIYLSVNNINPSKWFGGTWEQIAKGRTLVGVDTSQTEFNTVKKTGGEKKHQLTTNEMPTTGMIGVDSGKTEAMWTIGEIKDYPSGTYKITRVNISQGSHNNLPPYFTCYIWCRTA